MKSFLLASCVSLLLHAQHQVEAHGWMAQPCPRSTSSPNNAPATCLVSTGTASTSGQCGKVAAGAASAWSTTWVRGTTQNVAYQRANAHGNTGNTVSLSLAPGTTFVPTTSSASTVALKDPAGASTTFRMDVSISSPQSTQVFVPANFPLGPAVLQFLWKPTSGGSWYDCADITIVAPPTTDPCANTKCSDICTPVSNSPVCSCKAGRVFSGASTTTCVDLPPAAKVTLLVKGDTTKPSGSVSGQDTFTSALESSFSSLVGYVNFDVATYNAQTDISTVKLEIDSSPSKTGQQLAADLTNFVKNPTLAKTFASTYPPVSLQLDGGAVVMAPTSSPTTSPSSSPSSSPTQSGGGSTGGSSNNLSTGNAGYVSSNMLTVAIGVFLVVVALL